MSENAQPSEPLPPEEPQVEIHKPKPVHSWREFLKEYIIVVLGVITALAAEQVAEWVHWRNEVASARQAIASEMAGNVQSAIARLEVDNCVERRLDELSQILDSASR